MTTASKKKVIITGASGYLGQHVLASLDDTDYEIHAVYHKMKAFAEAMKGKSVHVNSLDLTNSDAIDSYFERYGPFDVCLHLAALSSPRICEQEQETARALNVPTHFLNKLVEQDCLIVATSTDQVYGGTKGLPYTESDSSEPLNVYAQTKVQLEEYLSGKKAALLRSSILLGPKTPFCGEAHDTFLHFCHSRQGQPTTYFTDEYRSVMAVGDVVKIMNYLILNPDAARGIYNMGGPHRISRYDMAQAVQQHFEFSEQDVMAARKVDQAPGAIVSPLDITMSSGKLQALVGFDFSSLADIVKTTFVAKK